jgi:MinD superfamily P-loop ATPase
MVRELKIITALHVPQINDACNLCLDCMRICPSDVFSYDLKKKQFTIHAKTCTGCNLCRDICEQQAISFTDKNTAQVIKFKLVECQLCNKAYPSIHDWKICPICYQKSRF